MKVDFDETGFFDENGFDELVFYRPRIELCVKIRVTSYLPNGVLTNFPEFSNGIFSLRKKKSSPMVHICCLCTILLLTCPVSPRLLGTIRDISFPTKVFHHIFHLEQSLLTHHPFELATACSVSHDKLKPDPLPHTTLTSKQLRPMLLRPNAT